MANAALEKKGEDLIKLHVGAKTTLADAFVIVTGRSNIQTRAIADAVEEAAGEHLHHVEGYQDGEWILVDLGSVVVHVFTPEQRAFYNLERLWGEHKSAPISDAS